VSNSRDYPFQLGFDIGNDIRVGIFIYGQPGGCVGDKYLTQAGGNTALAYKRTNPAGNIYKFGLAAAGYFKAVQGQGVRHA